MIAIYQDFAIYFVVFNVKLQVKIRFEKFY